MGYFWVILVYVLFLIGVSVYRSRFVKTQTDFMVAGRGVKTWALIGTLVCTWIGSGSIIAGAGLAYREGISQLWMSGGAWLGIVCVYFLAGRVRRIAEYTLPDLLEKRYNSTARILGTIAVIIAYTTIVGYQFRGGAMVLELVADIPREQGIIYTGVFIIAFTMLGGMMSIVAIDVFNGIMITLGILIAVPILYFGVGGAETITANVSASHFEVFGTRNIWWAMGVFFPVFFLLLGESNMYQKFFSARDEAAARKSVVGWVVGTIVIETAICFLAIIAASKFINLVDTETIVFHTAKHGGEIGLPFWAGAILLCAAIAIILSTANSFLLTPSTNITRDIYQRFINPQASQGRIIFVQRTSIVLLGIMAYMLLTQFTTVLDMALTAYTMIGAGITPALLAAFLWKRVTPQGGVASMLGGMIGTIIAKFGFTPLHTILSPLFGNWSVYQMYFAENVKGDYIIYYALIPSIVLLIVVSLLTKPSPKEKWAPFIDN